MCGWTLGSGFWVSGFGFRGPNFRCKVSCFRFRLWGFEFGVESLFLGVWCLPSNVRCLVLRFSGTFLGGFSGFPFQALSMPSCISGGFVYCAWFISWCLWLRVELPNFKLAPYIFDGKLKTWSFSRELSNGC